MPSGCASPWVPFLAHEEKGESDDEGEKRKGKGTEELCRTK